MRIEDIKKALSLLGFGIFIALLCEKWFWIIMGFVLVFLIVIYLYYRLLKPRCERKKQEKKKTQPMSWYKLLYFYGGPNDDLATVYWGNSYATELVELQNERFRNDPPSVPIEMVHVGERKDLIEKYDVRVFPFFILVDKKGYVLQKWGNGLTGTVVNNYIKKNL
ncbi:MAG: hypothetical protein PUC18_06125 [Prevotellaceae bacterium]|nr:hypothetical protein [Prevotellaceae bacterium]